MIYSSFVHSSIDAPLCPSTLHSHGESKTTQNVRVVLYNLMHRMFSCVAAYYEVHGVMMW
ncbi:uncharacterized protein PHALS_15101 [Plasmopara halstedii]|uniref:Uncharacterized protein n=1 Tax=Plasmopara halstedii TaxID=4781 RepID=A0A0P1B116_PLAHL|nr:uncharacterized protein PHALS_15101 [Plasmopara halstedii]CEG48094.1 hypothetical protein PHALS_15101 [Plasmopara halstedii]|eukprot:XP_024584463.1 hypothetical protein PHALS_15101 [Plasmopara halstedii]